METLYKYKISGTYDIGISEELADSLIIIQRIIDFLNSNFKIDFNEKLSINIINNKIVNSSQNDNILDCIVLSISKLNTMLFKITRNKTKYDDEFCIKFNDLLKYTINQLLEESKIDGNFNYIFDIKIENLENILLEDMF